VTKKYYSIGKTTSQEKQGGKNWGRERQGRSSVTLKVCGKLKEGLCAEKESSTRAGGKEKVRGSIEPFCQSKPERGLLLGSKGHKKKKSEGNNPSTRD